MPGRDVALESIVQQLKEERPPKGGPFSLLSQIARAAIADDYGPFTHEIVLRALERKAWFREHGDILDSIVRAYGLYPYVETPAALSDADMVSYELHRPDGLNDDQVVFHEMQAEVYRQLIDGRSIILSAPTSFGKSLVIDALVAANVFRNVVIIVPTLALIDETRRRLQKYEAIGYKVISQVSQKPADKNLMIFTQERFLEYSLLPKVDFFVIDEFYKVGSSTRENSRRDALNEAVYRLLGMTHHFYMLGPGVGGVDKSFVEKYRPRVIETDYTTVVTEVVPVRPGAEPQRALAALCRKLDEPTMIYCSSPGRAATVARQLIDEGIGSPRLANTDAVRWLGDTYHPEWHFVQALSMGIGIHHGRIPRAISQFVVDLFNEGFIQYLICTSTLIEGVNTTAKNIIVYDGSIDRKGFDLFTFNNIKGRSGRMFKHFVGRVFTFHEPPAEGLPFVDFEITSQGRDTSDAFLLQLDEDDLTVESRKRVRSYWSEDVLPMDLLRTNRGVEPSRQIAFALDVIAGGVDLHDRLSWRGWPDYGQLLTVVELMWKHFDARSLGSGSAVSPKQLVSKVKSLERHESVGDAVAREAAFWKDKGNQYPVDRAVQSVLDFRRLWAEFHLPNLLHVTSRIQKHVYGRMGLAPGDYEAYAAAVESTFLPPVVHALEEYGLPPQISLKLSQYVDFDGDLDEARATLRHLQLDGTNLSKFEQYLIARNQRFL